jgi:hypothetical protein
MSYEWNGKEFVVVQDLEEFTDAIIAVCKKYNLSISHEDRQGAFQIVKYNEYYTDWFRHASDDRNEEHNLTGY